MSRSLRDGVEWRVWIHRHRSLKTLTSFQQTWIELVQGRHYILIIRLHRNSCFPQKLYVLYSFNKQLFLSQLRPRKLSLRKLLKERNPERLRCLWRSAVCKDWPIGRRSHPGKDRSPSCKMQPQQEGLVHILYLVPNSPQSLGLLSSIMTSEPVLSVSPTLILAMKAQTWFLLSTLSPVMQASLVTISPLSKISLNFRLISSCLCSKELTISRLTKSACPFQ